MNTSFLYSNRFQAIVLMAIVGILKAKGVIDPVYADAIISIAGFHTVLRTVDRASEKFSGKK